MAGETRSDRADRIRESVRALKERSSFRQAADAISETAGERISVGAIRSLLGGSTPPEPQLQIYEAWARATGELLPNSPGGRPRWLDNQTIGRMIREIRTRRGWSQQQLADYLEIPSSQADVSRWERGEKRPGYDILEAIARAGGGHAEIFQPGGELPLGAIREAPVHAYGAPDDAATAEMLFEHFEGVVRRMGGKGVAPEEMELRKLDVVEGLKRLHAAAGAVPAWVYILEGRIKRGEI